MKKMYTLFAALSMVLTAGAQTAYNLEVYGTPAGSSPTFTLGGKDFVQGTPLSLEGNYGVADSLKMTSAVPEGYGQNTTYDAATSTFKVTFLYKQTLTFGDLGKVVSFDNNNFASAIDTTKWYVISNKRSDNTSNLQGRQRFMLYRQSGTSNGQTANNKFWMALNDNFQNGTEITDANSMYLYRFIKTGNDGQYYIQCANGRLFGNLPSNGTILSANEPDQGGYPYLVQQVGDNAGFFYLQDLNSKVVMTNNAVNQTVNNIGYGTVTGWGTEIPNSATSNNNNVWQFIPVEFANTLNTVTYLFKDSKTGDTLYTYTQRAAGGSTVTYSGPTSSTYATFDTPAQIAKLEGDSTVTVTVTQSLPFTASKDFATATWYYFSNAHNRYVNYTGSDDNIAVGDKAETEGFQWAFIGNAIKGFKIVNKTAGDKKYLNAPNKSATSAVTMSADEMYWTIVKGNDTQAPSIAGRCFDFAVNNLYLNNYQGAGQLKLWSQNPSQDQGSNFAVTLATPSTTSHKVTWQYKAGEEVLDTLTQTVADGETATFNGPTTFAYATVTAPGAIANVTKDTTVTVNVTLQALPFTASKDFATATWYYFSNVHNRYVNYTGSDDNIAVGDKAETEGFQWAFIGNAIKGFKIVNKAAGDKKYLYAANKSSEAAVSMSADEMYWTIVKGNDTQAPSIAGKSFDFAVNNLYLNNLSGAGQLKLWRQSPSEDAGSNFSVTIASSEKAHTVTWEYKSGNDVLDTYTQTAEEGNTVQFGGKASFDYATVEAPATFVMGAKDTTMTVNVTLQELPFKASKDSLTATWYYLSNYHKRYVYYNNNDENIPFGDLSESADYQWAFIGNAIKGFKIVNRAAGMGKNLFAANKTAQAAVTLSADDMYWTVVKGSDTQAPDIAGKCFDFAVNNLYLNNYGGQGQLKLWSQNPSQDAGSNFSVTEVASSHTDAISKLTVNTDADAPRYNLAGQRVSKSYKGVVIVGGKKIVQK